MGTREAVSKEITNLGEDITIYNATQTTDDETAYESIVTDDYVDGTNTGTSEKAVVQPMNQSRNQEAEGRLLEGDMSGVFKHDSAITNNSLVKVDANSFLYKVKKLDQLRMQGERTHYEVVLEFIEVVP